MKIHFRIEDMTCGHCVARVRRVLEAQEGVEVLAVAIGSASLDLQGGEPKAALEALSKAGFPARVVTPT